jgi:hypothetical protein
MIMECESFSHVAEFVPVTVHLCTCTPVHTCMRMDVQEPDVFVEERQKALFQDLGIEGGFGIAQLATINKRFSSDAEVMDALRLVVIRRALQCSGAANFILFYFLP